MDIPAIKILRAVYSIYTEASDGDQIYAKGKANSFLKQCGANINKPKEQFLNLDQVKDVAHRVLDKDSEAKFLELMR